MTDVNHKVTEHKERTENAWVLSGEPERLRVSSANSFFCASFVSLWPCG